MKHCEIPVKVNAWVDEGIAPLVLALNEFPNVWTLDSCQGGDGKPAYVYFDCEDGKDATILLAAELTDYLFDAESRVYLFPREDGTSVVGILEIQPEKVRYAAEVLKSRRRGTSDVQRASECGLHTPE